MRLIDADHLKWNVGGIKCGEITIEYLLWIIDNQEPTIEAIPTDWIKSYALSTGKAILPFNAMINEWRRTR